MSFVYLFVACDMFAVYRFNKISVFLLIIPRKGHCYILIEQNRVHGVEKECGIIFLQNS